MLAETEFESVSRTKDWVNGVTERLRKMMHLHRAKLHSHLREVQAVSLSSSTREHDWQGRSRENDTASRAPNTSTVRFQESPVSASSAGPSNSTMHELSLSNDALMQRYVWIAFFLLSTVFYQVRPFSFLLSFFPLVLSAVIRWCVSVHIMSGVFRSIGGLLLPHLTFIISFRFLPLPPLKGTGTPRKRPS